LLIKIEPGDINLFVSQLELELKQKLSKIIKNYQKLSKSIDLQFLNDKEIATDPTID